MEHEEIWRDFAHNIDRIGVFGMLRSPAKNSAWPTKFGDRNINS